MEMKLTVCKYTNIKRLAIQREILFMIEIFDVKHFSFYIKPSSGHLNK